MQAFKRAAAAAGGPTEGMFTVDCTRLQNVTILQLLSCASASAQTSQCVSFKMVQYLKTDPKSRATSSKKLKGILPMYGHFAIFRSNFAIFRLFFSLVTAPSV